MKSRSRKSWSHLPHAVRWPAGGDALCPLRQLEEMTHGVMRVGELSLAFTSCALLRKAGYVPYLGSIIR